MKALVLISVMAVGIFASQSFKDSDRDGVIDKRDRCRHTPFFDIVDKRGCTVKTLAVKRRKG